MRMILRSDVGAIATSIAKRASEDKVHRIAQRGSMQWARGHRLTGDVLPPMTGGAAHRHATGLRYPCAVDPQDQNASRSAVTASAALGRLLLRLPWPKPTGRSQGLER